MDDATLLEQFESCDLPFERWSHRTHLRVAYLYLRRHPFDKALRRMRSGIRAYNRANRVPDGLESGYHETLTVAWLRVVDSHLRETAPDSDRFLDAHAELPGGDRTTR